MFTVEFGRFRIDAEAPGEKSELAAALLEASARGAALVALCSGTGESVSELRIVFRNRGGGSETGRWVPVPQAQKFGNFGFFTI